MLAQLLNPDERTALLALLTFLSLSDGRLDPGEEAFLAEKLQSLELEVSLEALVELARGLDLEKACAPIQRPAAARVVLAELIDLAYRDGDYSEPEREGLQAIAEALGQPESLADIERWVAEGRHWMLKGRELLGLELLGG